MAGPEKARRRERSDVSHGASGDDNVGLGFGLEPGKAQTVEVVGGVSWVCPAAKCRPASASATATTAAATTAAANDTTAVAAKCRHVASTTAVAATCRHAPAPATATVIATDTTDNDVCQLGVGRRCHR